MVVVLLHDVFVTGTIYNTGHRRGLGPEWNQAARNNGMHYLHEPVVDSKEIEVTKVRRETVRGMALIDEREVVNGRGENDDSSATRSEPSSACQVWLCI